MRRVLSWLWHHKWTASVALLVLANLAAVPLSVVFLIAAGGDVARMPDNPFSPLITVLLFVVAVMTVWRILGLLLRALSGIGTTGSTSPGPIDINGMTYVRGSAQADAAQRRASNGSSS